MRTSCCSAAISSDLVRTMRLWNAKPDSGSTVSALELGEALLDLLARRRTVVKRFDVAAQIHGHVCKFPARQFVEQFGIGVVGERIFTVRARLAGVEIGVRELEASSAGRRDRRRVPGTRVGEALDEQLLRLRRGRLEAERLERSDLRQDSVEEPDEAREQTRLPVVGAEVLLVFLARVAVNEVLLGRGRHDLHDLVVLLAPGGARELRNDLADRAPVGRDREVFAREQIFHLESVGLAKRALEHGAGDLEADE